MRKFNIKVNGNVYEVDVEEVGNASNMVKPATTINAPKEKTVINKIVEKPKPQVISTGQEVISAPMPGSVWKVHVSEGQMVEAGDVLLILEAMKMENEILAPKAGKVVKVYISDGNTVNTGEQLIVLE